MYKRYFPHRKNFNLRYNNHHLNSVKVPHYNSDFCPRPLHNHFVHSINSKPTLSPFAIPRVQHVTHRHYNPPFFTNRPITRLNTSTLVISTIIIGTLAFLIAPVAALVVSCAAIVAACIFSKNNDRTTIYENRSTKYASPEYRQDHLEREISRRSEVTKLSRGI